MDEEIERLMVGVRADTTGFARDVDAMRATLAGPLASGADRAGKQIEASLSHAMASGKTGFDDLGKTALKVLGEIAAAAIRSGVGGIGGGTGGGGGSAGGGGLVGLLSGLIGGLAGRAIGGPVSPGTPYLVGERGPELFVPTAAGQVVANGTTQPARAVQVAITINAPAGDSAAAMTRSSRQIARAVRAALQEGG